MISRIITKTVDLQKVQKTDQLEGPLYQLENEGHTFRIVCNMGTDPASISGTASARFLRPDETTVYFTGSISGNVVEITLPQSCYTVNGRFGMVVFVTGGGVASAVYAVAGTVARSTTEDVIDPTETIPSLEELIAQIEACEQATDNANAAAQHAVRFDTAQTLTDAQKTQARTNIDVPSNEKFDDFSDAFDSAVAENIPWVVDAVGKRQNYTNGTLKTSAQYAVTNYIDVAGYKYIHFASVASTATTTTTGAAFFSDENVETYISGVSGFSGFPALGYAEKYAEVPEGAKYARFSLLADATDDFWLKGIANIHDALNGITESFEQTLNLGGMMPEETITPWLQGGINTDTGGTQTSAYKVRSAGLFQGKDLTQNEKARFIVADEYKITCVEYDGNTGATGEFVKTVFKDVSGSVEAEINPNYFYRFVLEKDTEITPSSIQEGTAKFVGLKWTDKALADGGRSADAKVTGDLIAALADSVGSAAHHPTSPLIIGAAVTQQGRDTTVPHRARTKYIAIQPGTCYVFKMDSDAYTLYNAFVYSGNTQGTMQRQIDVIDGNFICFKAGANENFFRVAIYYTSDMEGHDFTEEEATSVLELITIKTVQAVEGKKERTGTNEWFTVTVHRPLAFGGSDVNNETQEIECILRLPTNYSSIGTPTRAILACHGAEGYIDQATGHWAATGWDALMDAILNAGYAVFDCNVLPASAGTNAKGFCVGSPLALDAAKKAYDYVQANYNVYREIFVHGTSMGGILASAFTKNYPQLVLAESSMAGRDLSLYFYRVENGTYTDSNPEFAQAWGYASVTAMKEDKWSHIVGMGPVLTLHKYENGVMQYPPDRETDFDAWMDYYSDIQKQTKASVIGECTAYRAVPYKTWESWGDSVQQTKAKLIMHKALRANGCMCEAVVYDNYDHADIGFGKVEDMRNQLIAWYKRWE